jgi:cobalt-zinc-cadmium efflux system outer membrane protein
LPTRLRAEAEAAEAMRQASRIQIELAAAISQWRQAAGLLP